MSKVVSQENLVDFGQQFKNKLSAVAISGSYNDLVDTPGDLQEYRQFTIFSPQAEGDTPDWPGDNDWKWYTNLDKLAPTSNPNAYYYDDWFTYAYSTDNTPIIWIATATFQSSDGSKVSDWEIYQATGSTGAPGQDGQDGADGQKGDTGNGISLITKTGTSGLVDTYTITFTNGNTTTFTVTNGADGTTGPQGVGIESIELTAQASGGSTDEYTITLTDGRTSTFDVHHGVNGTNGTNGTDGAAATITVGTVTTGAEGSSATVTNSGTSSAAVLNFTIPVGATGATGPSGTLNTNNSTAQTVNSSEALSGNVKLHKVSKTGSYNDLLNKPSIPTKVSDLTNDQGYTSNVGTITGITMNGVSKGTSGTVNLGTVLTSHQDISGKENTTNKVTSLSSSSTDTEYPSAKCVYDALQQPSGQGTMYVDCTVNDQTLTLSDIKNYNVFIIEGCEDPNTIVTLFLPQMDASVDGRIIKLIIRTGSINILSDSSLYYIGSASGTFSGDCVLEAVYYESVEHVYIYQISV